MINIQLSPPEMRHEIRRLSRIIERLERDSELKSNAINSAIWFCEEHNADADKVTRLLKLVNESDVSGYRVINKLKAEIGGFAKKIAG